MAHVTGWGKEGPMSSLPGLDAISFFGINGMLSDNLMVEGGITCPVTGMGDFTTAVFWTSASSPRSTTGSAPAAEIM